MLEGRSARSFEARIAGRVLNGIVTRAGDRFFAYQNLCKHVPVTLDAGDGDVMTQDGSRLQCHMHGAIYELETGECTAGPCVGAKLNSLNLVVERDRILIIPPEVIADV